MAPVQETVGRVVSGLTDASECKDHQWSLLTAGYTTACARGAVDTKCWGTWNYWNPSGQWGLFAANPSSTPPLVLGGEGAIAAAATGWFHTCAAAANGVWCWGDNSNGQLGDGTVVSRQAPAQVAHDFGDQVVALSTKAMTTCALTKSGDVWCWGNNSGYIAGAEGVPLQLVPNEVDLGGKTARQIAVGGGFACAVATEGEILCWGSNNYSTLGVLGVPQTAHALAVDTGGKRARFVATALESACAVFEDNTTACWGRNDYGQLATGDQQLRSTPTFVSLASPSGDVPIDMDGGGRHFCARYSDGSLECWGKNTCWETSGVNQSNLMGGQLGLGIADSSMQMAPRLVSTGGATVTDVKLGLDNTCASFADGSVKCWGCNSSPMEEGELGAASIATNADILINNAPSRRNGLPLGDAGACFTAPALDSDSSCGDVSVSATKRYNPNVWNDGAADLGYPHAMVVPSSINVDEGNSGTGTVSVVLTGPQSVVTCAYTGGSTTPHPTVLNDVADGARYLLRSCTLGAQAGDVLDVLSIRLHVDDGDSASAAGRTRVSALFAAPRPCTGGVASGDLRSILASADAADTAYMQASLDTAGVDAKWVFSNSGQTPASVSAHAALARSIGTAIGWSDQLLAFGDRRRKAAASDPDEVVAAALLTFAAETRSMLGSYAPPRRFNQACPDFVGDQLLVDLVDAVLQNDRALYAASLGKIEAALQCSTLANELDLNETLALAYDASLSRFPEDIRPIARRGLMSALLNLFLIVHDDTKVLGPTPLYTWMSDNRVALGQVLAEPNSVPRLAGLWLRSPAGDQLVQIQKLCEASMSTVGCVSGGHLLDALIDPLRLGVGACTALEMVSTPFDPARGYVCDRGLCAIQAGQLVPGSGTPMLDRLSADGGLTQFGVNLASLQSDRCRGPAERTDGGGSSGSAPDIYTCATSGLMSVSGRNREACVLDTMAAPRTMGFEDIRRSWGNDPCAAAGEGGGDNPDDPPDHATPPIDRPGDDAPEDAQKGLSAAEAQLHNGDYRAGSINTVQALGRANVAGAYDYTLAQLELTITFVTKYDPDLRKVGGDAAVVYDKTNIMNGLTFKVRDDLSVVGTENAILEMFSTTFLFVSSKLDSNGHEKNKYCPEGSFCASCSAAGSLIHDLLSCGFTQGALSPIPRGGGVIDPSPINDSNSSSWGTCFGAGMLPTVPTACLALDCTDGSVPTLQGEHCVCSSNGGIFMPPIINCGALTCDGIPVATSSGCKCIPFGQDPQLPPGLPPVGGCQLCTRTPDPAIQRCSAQPQMCYFQNEPTL